MIFMQRPAHAGDGFPSITVSNVLDELLMLKQGDSLIQMDIEEVAQFLRTVESVAGTPSPSE